MLFHRYFFITALSLLLLSCSKVNTDIYGKKGDIIAINLSTIYETKIPRKLRQIFNSYQNLDISKDEDNDKVSVFGEYISGFAEKFIVVEELELTDLSKDKNNNCGIGAYRLTILISPQKMRAWNVYLERIGKNNYRLCRIIDLNLSEDRRKELSYLKKFKNYWI